MLFSSIVFMSRTFRGQWISVVLVFILKFSVAAKSQIQNDNPSSLDNDFGNFLRELGSKVYKTEKLDVTQNEIRATHDTSSTATSKNYRRTQNTFNTQKAILQDVLMMKLVSYYEDKYKLSHLAPTTTERITISDNANSKGFIKQNLYNYKEKAEALSSNVIPKSTKQVVTSLNRRLNRDMTKIEDYQVPEVVIF